MRAGRFRDLIALDLRVETNAGGVPAVTWQVLYDEVPADIAAMSAREQMAANAMQGETQWQIVIRWLPDLPANGTMRARDLVTGVIYNLTPPIYDNKTRTEWITFGATSGVNNG